MTVEQTKNKGQYTVTIDVNTSQLERSLDLVKELNNHLVDANEQISKLFNMLDKCGFKYKEGV